MSDLHEAQRNNAIGRLEAGESQTAVAAFMGEVYSSIP